MSQINATNATILTIEHRLGGKAYPWKQNYIHQPFFVWSTYKSYEGSVGINSCIFLGPWDHVTDCVHHHIEPNLLHTNDTKSTYS